VLQAMRKRAGVERTPDAEEVLAGESAD